MKIIERIIVGLWVFYNMAKSIECAYDGFDVLCALFFILAMALIVILILNKPLTKDASAKN